MKFIQPLLISDAVIASSTVPEADYSAWNAGTAYAVGDFCILIATHKIYQCLIANTNNRPDLNLAGLTPKWLQIGATNRWKMFDESWSSQTEAASSIVVSFSPGKIIDSLALLNVAATSITVEMSVGASVVFSRTTSMLGGLDISDWYAYFFSAFVFKTDWVATDLPPYSGATITISIQNAGGTARCGLCVLGRAFSIGDAQYGAAVGILDYSRRDVDAFGNTTIVRRKYSKRASLKLELESALVDNLANVLADYRSVPVVWIGVDNMYSSLIIYGFYKSFNVEIAYPSLSFCSLEIEGLT